MKKTYVIYSFPGCGATYCIDHFGYKFDIEHINGNDFKWVKDDECKYTLMRDNNYPENCVQHVKEFIGNVDFIIITDFDSLLRRALHKAGIDVVIVYPNPSMKDEFIKRYDGKSERIYTENLKKYWNDYLRTIIKENYGFLRIELNDEMPYLDIMLLYSLKHDVDGLNKYWLN